MKQLSCFSPAMVAVQRTLLFLCVLAGASVGHAAPRRIAEQRDAVTQISVQRTWCYGSCPIDSLTLKADGNASYVSVRNGFQPNGRYVGHITPEKFQALASWLTEQNFFGLRSEIGRGNIDSSDFIVSVQGTYGRFIVAFRGNEFHIGQKFKDTLLATSTGIAWKKDAVAQSEIKGSVYQPSPPERKAISDMLPTRFTQVVASNLELPSANYSTITDQAGQFQFFLPPGRYNIRVNERNDAAPLSWMNTSFRQDASIVSVKEGASLFQKITLRPLR